MTIQERPADEQFDASTDEQSETSTDEQFDVSTDDVEDERADATSPLDVERFAESIAPEPAEPIEIDGVSKRFGGVTALSDVSITIEPGEFHGLAGPNGSGKTTLGRIVVGLTRPDEGTVRGPTDRVGYGFQRPRLYPSLTVRENVETFRRAGSASQSTGSWVNGVLEALRLDRVAHQPAAELSGGFKKKLDLAIAVLDRPSYLWLDEPLSDLDDVSVSRVVAMLSEYVAVGGGVVVATHNVEEFAEAFSHFTVFLDGNGSRTIDLARETPDEVLSAEFREQMSDVFE